MTTMEAPTLRETLTDADAPMTDGCARCALIARIAARHLDASACSVLLSALADGDRSDDCDACVRCGVIARLVALDTAVCDAIDELAGTK
ncbi:MAG: hypothetical protein AB7Q17_15765 [Phycisphaerae bacterium]